VAPKLDYSHEMGCAVIGGYIYRGPITSLNGRYFFSDTCSGRLYMVQNANPALTPWEFETVSGAPSAGGTYAFGEDAAGNLYIAYGGGSVYVFFSQPSETIFVNGFDPN
jgi:hypothetical protein